MKLHHLGIVVKDINEALNLYRHAYKAEVYMEPVYDPVQRSTLCLVRAPQLSFSWELIEPLDSLSQTSALLQVGLHHVCYEVDEISVKCTELSNTGEGVMVMPPVPAVLFDGRRVAFFVFKDRTLVELLESNI